MPRPLLALLGALAAGVLAWLALPWLQAQLGGTAPPLEILENEEERGDEFAERIAAIEARYPSVPIQAFPDTTLLRARLAREVLERYYISLRNGQYPYDPVRHFRRQVSQTERYPWPEHPEGAWTLRTNREGLRMDAELGAGPYLAIAGDSHMEGALSNDESVPGRIAAALADERSELQVVNVSCGGYSFHQYLGTLEFLCGDEPGEYVDPDTEVPIEAYVMVVYGGNDFEEVLRLAHHFRGTQRPEGWGNENERLTPWRKSHPAALGQILNSIVYFRNAPSDLQVALTESLAIIEEVERHASRRGFRFAVAYLPSVLEVDPKRYAKELAEPIAGLGITKDEVRGVAELADAFLTGTQALGVETIDLRPTLTGGGPYYWHYDLHLNLEGSARVSERLLDWFRSVPEE